MVDRLSVSQLKRILAEHGVSYEHIVEKSELREKAARALNPMTTMARYAAVKPADDEESRRRLTKDYDDENPASDRIVSHEDDDEPAWPTRTAPESEPPRRREKRVMMLCVVVMILFSVIVLLAITFASEHDEQDKGAERE